MTISLSVGVDRYRDQSPSLSPGTYSKSCRFRVTNTTLCTSAVAAMRRSWLPTRSRIDGSCGCVQGTQALELFKELGKVRISGRAPKGMKLRITRLFAWDSDVDHFGGGKPVTESFGDLGDGFRFGRCLHLDFRDAQRLGHILMRRCCSNDGRIVHRLLF